MGLVITTILSVDCLPDAAHTMLARLAGNDYGYIKVQSSKAVAAAKASEKYECVEDGDGGVFVKAPGGYKFYLVPGEASGDPVQV